MTSSNANVEQQLTNCLTQEPMGFYRSKDNINPFDKSPERIDLCYPYEN